VARLVRSGGFYRPDALLEGLAPHLADPAAGIVDLHIYTFNAVDTFEEWRRAHLASLLRAIPA
jgi:methylenetetrahydrofolate reductase (NADPH)